MHSLQVLFSVTNSKGYFGRCLTPRFCQSDTEYVRGSRWPFSRFSQLFGWSSAFATQLRQETGHLHTKRSPGARRGRTTPNSARTQPPVPITTKHSPASTINSITLNNLEGWGGGLKLVGIKGKKKKKNQCARPFLFIWFGA